MDVLDILWIGSIALAIVSGFVAIFGFSREDDSTTRKIWVIDMMVAVVVMAFVLPSLMGCPPIP